MVENWNDGIGPLIMNHRAIEIRAAFVRPL